MPMCEGGECQNHNGSVIMKSDSLEDAALFSGPFVATEKVFWPPWFCYNRNNLTAASECLTTKGHSDCQETQLPRQGCNFPR